MSLKGSVLPERVAQVNDFEVADTQTTGTEARSDESVKKREGKREGVSLRDREPGKSVLPFSRVQKIMKADKELPIVAKDATFLISLATEEFIKRLSQACQRLAEREKRTTVQQRDVAGIVRRVDEFLFLEEILGSQELTGKRKPKASAREAEAPSHGGQDQSQPTLDTFMQKTTETEDAGGTRDIVMNEDGAMLLRTYPLRLVHSRRA